MRNEENMKGRRRPLIYGGDARLLKIYRYGEECVSIDDTLIELMGHLCN